MAGQWTLHPTYKQVCPKCSVELSTVVVKELLVPIRVLGIVSALVVLAGGIVMGAAMLRYITIPRYFHVMFLALLLPLWAAMVILFVRSRTYVRHEPQQAVPADVRN